MAAGQPDPAVEAPEPLVFLSGLHDDDWNKLLSHTRRAVFHAGDVVMHQGERDRSLYIIVDGRLVLEFPNDSETSRPLMVMEAGAVLGEMSFFDGLPRSVGVRALTDGDLLQLSYEEFERFADEEPALARLLLIDLGRILALRLRAANAEAS
jgi:CRP-like cAMP-binding protein